VSKLSKDSLDGVELIKVLSLSILNESDPSVWLDSLAADGSLRLLINSLSSDDRDMKTSKCQKSCKAFYAFESKMCLLTKVASSQKGAQTLVHLGLVSTLSSLECLEIYTYLLNQNEVCFTVFISVFRLLVTLADSSSPTEVEELARFLLLKSPVLYAILKTPDSYRNSEEGQKVLFYVTALLSKLTPFLDTELHKTLVSFVQSLKDVKTETEAKILTNVLQGCIHFSLNNRK